LNKTILIDRNTKSKQIIGIFFIAAFFFFSIGLLLGQIDMTDNPELNNISSIDILVLGDESDESIKITVRTLEITLKSHITKIEVKSINSLIDLEKYTVDASRNTNLMIVGHSDGQGSILTTNGKIKIKDAQFFLEGKKFKSISYISCKINEFLLKKSENINYVSSGVIDGRIGAIEAALDFWDRKSLTSQPGDIRINRKIEDLNKIQKLEFFNSLQRNPVFTLFEDPLTYSNPSNNLLTELHFEWETFYKLSELDQLQKSSKYVNLATAPYTKYEYVTFHESVFEKYGLHEGEEILGKPIVPIQTLVVIDYDLKSFYGDYFAVKVKRLIETWDAPFTAQFGITLNVKTVLYLPQYHNSQSLGAPTLSCKVSYCTYFHQGVSMIPDTRDYYFYDEHPAYEDLGINSMIDSSGNPILGKWNSSLGAQQGYDLMIVLLKHPRDNGADIPTGGFAYHEGNRIITTMTHQFWHPQMTFLHELGHVFGGQHTQGIGEVLFNTNIASIPDGDYDNSAAAGWQPEDIFGVDTNKIQLVILSLVSVCCLTTIIIYFPKEFLLKECIIIQETLQDKI
jgi:hypothetical protein